LKPDSYCLKILPYVCSMSPFAFILGIPLIEL
jgi:hypothetical protein